MDDLISKKVVLEWLDIHAYHGWFEEKLIRYLKEEVEELPTIPTDGDLISRTALLNAIWQKEYGKDYDGVNLLNIKNIDIIENMPSYNSIKTELNGDLISRDYAIEQIKKAKENGYKFTYNTLIDFMKVLPTIPKTENPTKDIDSAIEYWKSVDENNNMVKWLSELQEYRKEKQTDSVLEKIKTELYKEIENDFDVDYCSGLYTAIEIIDKYISGKDKE